MSQSQPTKEEMDEAFEQNDEPQSFSEGVLAERRGSEGDRTPRDVEVTFQGTEYTMTIIDPPASDIKKLAAKGDDLQLEELEEPVDKYLVEPSREDLEEQLTFSEYQTILIQIVQRLAGVGDDLANQVAEELSKRSDGDEGN